jgi:hypothetical protein
MKIFFILFIFILGISLKITLNICKKPPRFILPVCIGYCSTISQWNFHSNKFIYRTNACQVTQHRTEYFLCPDSTHTAIELTIPLACSCMKHTCHR